MNSKDIMMQTKLLMAWYEKTGIDEVLNYSLSLLVRNIVQEKILGDKELMKMIKP